MNVSALGQRAISRLVLLDQNKPLIEAANILADPAVDLIVVCDDASGMVGVVSRLDIVARISHCQGHSCTETISMAMTRHVKFCRQEDDLEETWIRMKQEKLKNFPVIDTSGAPIAVAAIRDVLEHLFTELDHEESLLRDYVMGVGYR